MRLTDKKSFKQFIQTAKTGRSVSFAIQQPRWYICFNSVQQMSPKQSLSSNVVKNRRWIQLYINKCRPTDCHRWAGKTRPPPLSTDCCIVTSSGAVCRMRRCWRQTDRQTDGCRHRTKRRATMGATRYCSNACIPSSQ